MLSFFLEGHTTHGGGAMRELWPMAISVTLCVRPSGSLLHCYRVVAAGFDCWAAQQQQLVLLTNTRPHAHVPPRAPSTSGDDALMLLDLAGCTAIKGPVFSGPLTLGWPDLFSCLFTPRLLLLARAIWISTCSVNNRRSPGRLHVAETPRCCVLDAGNPLSAMLLNHLRWGAIADSDLLRAPGSA